MLDGSFHGARGQHLVLRGYPVGDGPIVQSYVDVCLDGWLEIEAMCRTFRPYDDELGTTMDQ